MQSLSNFFGWTQEDVGTPATTSLSATYAANRSFSEPREQEEEDLWGKLQKLFFKSEPDDIHKQHRSFDYVKNTSMHEKSTAPRSIALTSQRQNSILMRSDSTCSHGPRSSITKNSEKSPEKLKFSSTYIPEAFKQSFDLSFEIEDDHVTEALGTLELSTLYLFDQSTLYVKVIKASNLPAMDLFGTSDPFVKCYLLPDRKRKLETKIRRKTLNPIWNEVLSFEGLAYEKIKQRVLYLQMFDYDRFSRNDPIGEICLPLHTIDLSRELMSKLPLHPCEKSNKRGELLLSLCFQPIDGVFEIGVLKGRNLKPMDLNGTSDPYVKIWLFGRDKKIEKKKTSIIKNTLNPNFNQKFTFRVLMKKLREAQFEITVMDYDTIGRNDTIGKIYLGHKSTGLEKQHWKDMLANTRKVVSQWHVLKI